MFQKLMSTGNSTAGFFLRISLGVVMLAHGLQQTFGFLGGIGFSKKVAYYTNVHHVPWVFAVLGILIVSVGAICLILGLWGRVMAFLIGVFLFTAMILGGHIHNGIFMNWEGTRQGEGFEYHILGIGIAIAIVIYGSGWLSLDKWFTGNHRKNRQPAKSKE